MAQTFPFVFGAAPAFPSEVPEPVDKDNESYSVLGTGRFIMVSTDDLAKLVRDLLPGGDAEKSALVSKAYRQRCEGTLPYYPEVVWTGLTTVAPASKFS